MLNIFLKLVDRIIQLREHRLDKRKELFETLVEPIFDEASSVYSDYRMMLRSARSLIEQTNVDKAISRLESDRENYLATRTKLRSMAASIRPQDVDFDPGQQVSFAELVSLYISEIGELILARATHNVPQVTVSRSLIEQLKFIDPDTTNKQALVGVFDETLENMDARFQVVSTLYGQLRAAAYLGDEMSFALAGWLQPHKKLLYEYRSDEDV